ncbi:hypothetical protein BGX29_004716 [Mortierella sp. GBA35]|nr:hypothetical protein BGX29_004716 [Mortierella sp. GBA35]
MLTTIALLLILLSQHTVVYTHAQSTSPQQEKYPSPLQPEQQPEQQQQNTEITKTPIPYQEFGKLYPDSSLADSTAAIPPLVSIQTETPKPTALNTINFGILLPLNLSLDDEYHWRTIVVGGISAIRLAVEDINAQKFLPVNISLTMRNSQPPVRSPFGGSNAMMSAAYFVTSNVLAVIGDTVSWLSEYSAAVTSAVQCSFTSSTFT